MYRKGRLHRLAGEVASQLGDTALAAREFEKGGMHAEAAENALTLGESERAARLFVQAGQARRAAEIHEKNGKPEVSASLFEHTGDNLRATRLFLEARRPESAARCLETLIKSGDEPGDRRELLGLGARIGQQFLSRGYPEQGARWLEYAGRSIEAAKAWERAGKVERAVRAYLAAGMADEAAALAERQPPEALDAELAAEAYRRAQRWAEAAALYLEAGRPGDAASCLEQLGCPVEAAWAHEAAGDLVAAGQAYERASAYEEAADLYSRAGAMRDAARALEACGRLADGARCFLEAGDRLAAAELLERSGELDEAVKVLQSIPMSSEDIEGATLALGRLFERMGVDSIAAEHYRKALAYEDHESPNPEAWYRLANVLERTGRVREAVQAFGRVVSLDYNYRDAARRLAGLEERLADEAPAHRTSLPDRYDEAEKLEGFWPGEAFSARDKVMDRQVVLRRFGRHFAPNESAVERILRDIRRVARLHHPSIAAIHDAGEDSGGLFIVQEAVDGKTLREVLASEGPLDVPRTVQVITRVAEALDYAHGLGLLARTIRPENVVVGPSWDARLVDFGLALRHTDGAAPGNDYRAPEARRGERMDPCSDIYLLGVLGWEMLTGSPPPLPTSPNAEPPELPVDPARPVPDVLQRVIRHCLYVDRAHRLGSAQKLLEELHGTHLLPGALLANRYEILREIGRGGMGTVFQARDLVLDEPVALKVLSGPLDENVEKRFIQEIRLTRQINHPNIVRVHTFERWRELRFIVMEYIDGVDLRRWSKTRQPIPLGQVLEFVAGVASGLAAAHRLGIVHRDVKPENVLLDPEGRPRLCDFGIARQGDVHLTREGLVMGSPAYMAPEQIRGEAADLRADLYALGVLSFFLITGREPFASENVAEVLRMQIEETPPPLESLRPGVPQHIDALLRRLLEKDPNRRPASVFAFLEELTEVRARMNVVTA